VGVEILKQFYQSLRWFIKANDDLKTGLEAIEAQLAVFPLEATA